MITEAVELFVMKEDPSWSEVDPDVRERLE